MLAGRSLTRRVIRALTGAVAVFVVLLCGLAYLAFEQMEDNLVNTVLATEASHLLEQVREGDDIARVERQTELGSLLRIWYVQDEADKMLLPAPLRSLKTGSHILHPGQKTWHVAVVAAPMGELYVMYDATAHQRRVYRFGLIVLFLGAMAILAAFALAKSLARVVVEPLGELADSLSNWAPGAPDLMVRRDDEVGRLIEAFNRVQMRVDESIAFEREFASNLGHEIRTALAAIRSDAEMVLLEGETGQSARTRLKRMLSCVDSVSASLSSAETLARRGSSVSEEVNIRQCVDQAWLTLEAEADRRGLILVNAVPDAYTEILDPYALLMVARNLMRNAAEHAAPATLTVSQTGEHGIAFADNGPGISREALPLLFERYYRGNRRDSSADPGDGSPSNARRGLGLAIARQVCNNQHWELTVRSRDHGDDKGTVFILRFS